jgi:hypothetical protein
MVRQIPILCSGNFLLVPYSILIKILFHIYLYITNNYRSYIKCLLKILKLFFLIQNDYFILLTNYFIFSLFEFPVFILLRINLDQESFCFNSFSKNK